MNNRLSNASVTEKQEQQLHHCNGFAYRKQGQEHKDNRQPTRREVYRSLVYLGSLILIPLAICALALAVAVVANLLGR